MKKCLFAFTLLCFFAGESMTLAKGISRSSFHPSGNVAPNGFNLLKSSNASLSKSQIQERLSYLVSLRSFSKAKPLSQTRLMGWVIELGRWGAFPEKYKGGGQGIPNCDDHITRANARLFTREWVGQDLQQWSLMGEDFMPKMQEDRLGWWYNTGNTMYARPSLHVIGKPNVSKQRILVKFQMKHQRENMSSMMPEKVVGAGTAVLEQQKGNWVVTSWQVTRNRNWSYGEREPAPKKPQAKSASKSKTKKTPSKTSPKSKVKKAKLDSAASEQRNLLEQSKHPFQSLS